MLNLRIVYLILIMVVSYLGPVYQQGGNDNPHYMDCGAESYFIAEYYAINPLNIMFNDFDPNESYSQEFLIELYMNASMVRSFLQEQNVILLPECLHDAYYYQDLINNKITDSIVFLMASNNVTQVYDPYIVIAIESFNNAQTWRLERMKIDIGMGQYKW